VGGSLAISLLQKAGAGTPALFMTLGAANLVVALLVARSIPARANG
jgi:hypothetical protein